MHRVSSVKVVPIAIALVVGAGSVARADGPEEVEARIRLVRVLATRGDYRGAIRELEVALKLEPSRRNLLFDLGAMHFHAARAEGWPMKDMARSMRYFERFVTVEPDAPERAEIDVAMAAMRARTEEARRRAAAIAAAKRASAAKADHPAMAPPPAAALTDERAVLVSSVNPEQAFAQALQLRVQGRNAEAVQKLLEVHAAEREAQQRREADERVRQAEERARQRAKEERERIEREKVRADNAALEHALTTAAAGAQRTTRRLLIGTGVSALVIGVAALGVGGYLLNSAQQLQELRDSQLQLRDLPFLEALSRSHEVAGGILAWTGGLLTIGGAALVIWQAVARTDRPVAAGYRIMPTPGGAMIEGRF